MTNAMHLSLTAIGRRLQAEYSPPVGTALPRELEELLARLVALEAGAQESRPTTEALQSAVAQPRLRR